MTSTAIGRRRYATLIVVLAALPGLALAQEYLSPLSVAVSPDESILYVAAHTGKQLLVVGLDNLTVA
ncbi:MAG: hypothetical protein U9Q79_05745, partial [Candidatus Hydrogenedentes bacterium]|nr:hypothetical protein [Candidatus Hydrogenedentota bacterium]